MKMRAVLVLLLLRTMRVHRFHFMKAQGTALQSSNYPRAEAMFRNEECAAPIDVPERINITSPVEWLQ